MLAVPPPSTECSTGLWDFNDVQCNSTSVLCSIAKSWAVGEKAATNL